MSGKKNLNTVASNWVVCMEGGLRTFCILLRSSDRIIYNRWHSSNWTVQISKCYCMYEVCPEAVQPYNMKNRDIYWRYKKHLYIGQWHFSTLQSRHLGTSHSSPNHHQLPHGIFLNLIDSLKSPPFQRWF